MNRLFLLIVLFLSFSSESLSIENHLRIGFGSCADQTQQQVIWNTITKTSPNLFIMTGDNVYLSHLEGNRFKTAYQMFNEQPAFKSFREKFPVMATWDDNDYGLRDGGKDFIDKNKSKSAFIDFFNYPEINSIQTKPQGIYHSRTLKLKGMTINIIMLDTRWYRDELDLSKMDKTKREQLKLGPYYPTKNTQSTLLGKTQWQWLENELNKNTTFTIIVSSIQLIPEFSGWEAWSNFPHEKERILSLIHQKTRGRTLFLSGDAHRAEISKLRFGDTDYWEVTSSALASKVYPAAPNKYRVGEAFIERNFGVLDFITNEQHLKTSFSIYNEKGEKKLSKQLVFNLQ